MIVSPFHQPGRASSKSRRAAFVALVVAGLTLGLVSPVQATITPTATALTIAQAIASSSVTVTGASFAALPPSGTPNGVSTSALGGFPIDGADYGILTSGDVASVDQPGTFASTNDGGGNVRGDTDYDVSILKIDLSVPEPANCLTFNFKFLSEEYPVYVGSAFNDAFIAELDTSDWTTSGSTISAPHNFAFDASNNVVSINSTGLGGMTAAEGAGTAFDGTTTGPTADSNGGATGLLEAATPVTAGAHSLYLSIFDQGDQILDSAVFLDNLRVGTVVNPATDCKPGATQPATLTLTKTIDNTGGGTAAATDWTLSATGPTNISGHTGDGTITGAPVHPGTYTLAESGPTGYTPSAWSCTGGTLTGSSLVLAAGDTASCSIKNTFIPPSPATLTLTKTVDNTGGGTAAATDWTLSATGPTTISGATGDTAITGASVPAGTYTLAESGPTGYTPSAWSCTGGTLTGSSLVLAAGDTASCSIKNTFIPPVTKVGLIAPTNTTCQQYVAGTAPTLPGINYSVKGGTIGQNINPGVFFYFSTVKVNAGDVVTTSQSTTNSSGALFLLNQGHAFIWDANCNKVGNGTSTNSGATTSFTFTTAGTYILQLQYTTKSLAGSAAPSSPPTYTFDTAINGTEVTPDTTSIGLFLQ